MSEPSASCAPIAISGVNRWVEPSRCERNVTPSSSTTRRSPSDTTWKPPESVRIGPSQSMNRCRPPSRAIRSAPGPQVEVVRVGQDDRGAGLGDLGRGERLDRGIGPDRHELRRLDHAVGQRQLPDPCPRRAIGRRRDQDLVAGRLALVGRGHASTGGGSTDGGSIGSSQRLGMPASARRGGGISYPSPDRWARARSVAIRPCGVRSRNPRRSRNGS